MDAALKIPMWITGTLMSAGQKGFPNLVGSFHFIKIGNALILERKICENALVLEDLYPTVTLREINKAKLYKTYFSLNVLRCENKAF